MIMRRETVISDKDVIERKGQVNKKEKLDEVESDDGKTGRSPSRKMPMK